MALPGREVRAAGAPLVISPGVFCRGGDRASRPASSWRTQESRIINPGSPYSVAPFVASHLTAGIPRGDGSGRLRDTGGNADAQASAEAPPPGSSVADLGFVCSFGCYNPQNCRQSRWHASRGQVPPAIGCRIRVEIMTKRLSVADVPATHVDSGRVLPCRHLPVTPHYAPQQESHDRVAPLGGGGALYLAAAGPDGGDAGRVGEHADVGHRVGVQRDHVGVVAFG